MKSPRICIIDYGMGNLRSVINALRHTVDCDIQISDQKHDLQKADILILPGVGAFRDAVEHLHERHLFDEINQQVMVENKPILAICLGMQLLLESSEENGYAEGFGWIKGKVSRFDLSEQYRVPHMGWDNIVVNKRYVDS